MMSGNHIAPCCALLGLPVTGLCVPVAVGAVVSRPCSAHRRASGAFNERLRQFEILSRLQMPDNHIR